MAKPTSTPPEPGWHDYPCHKCGTIVRCGETNTMPLCDDCRDAEIAAYYAEKDRRYRSGWGAPAPKPYPKSRRSR